ncbi:MAG: hypothetical protein IJH39_10700 [Clostridia bacterium]|nr:hypothetical protein [Clostridia bacterium]
MTKVKQIICVVVLMAISFAAGAICIYSKCCNTSWSLSSKITELSEELNSKVAELAIANEKLFAQGQLIHQYEVHDRVETDVENIRKIRANIFAYADASIHSEEETPLNFGSTNLQC